MSQIPRVTRRSGYIGLLAIYLGERMLQDVTLARVVLSGGGVLLVLAALAASFLAWRAATGDARRVEQIFLLSTLGCTLALIGFFLASDGTNWLGIDFAEPMRAARFRTAAAVLASITLAVSLLPALAAEWAVGPQRNDQRETSAVDRLRITQVAAAGLTVAMAGAALMLLGWVASERDKTLDLSYFRTASPGSAVHQIVESRGAPLRVLLFFPPANEVGDQVLSYFRALSGGAQNVIVEQHDRLAAPELAQEHRVSQDGTVVLAYNDRSETIIMPLLMRDARGRLRTFDAEVQRVLMRVAREERTVYLTTGHGELNDESPTGPFEAASFRSIDALRRLFGLLNYRVADLSLQSGLGNDVPTDAAMVVVLGPSRPFLEPELAALDRYLERGGSVLLALEPGGNFQLGPLRQRLGVDFRAVHLADDRQHVRLRGNNSDRQLIITDRFTSHAALATLGRASMGSGMLLMGAGYLEPADSLAAPTFVVRSLSTTFADRNRDFEFNESTEERKQYALVAALELTKAAEDTVTTAGRAMVFADADLFSDAVVTSLGLNAALAADAVRWLGREENLAGETTSEEDVPVVHTRAQDVMWFHATILGAPALVLGFGLWSVRRRRRGPGRVQSADPSAGPPSTVSEETPSHDEVVHR